ncbi:hypothetical protein Ea357_051 [Erwinia phage Ea35-70]|uniref:Uncharacterized protein n=1 Tax=Erwinia phage Ea35-70 TaxID=1429768 RepID=W6ARX0_9CAUD|nr:hypothetical protein Ea357_051 [Erwinia phage Ea35-70]AHI60201.1 hypothetical protein Ea357_051 [Erwinia phage Ea35-70]
MRTLVVVLTEPAENQSIALTIRDPYHELTFDKIAGWIESATGDSVFRDKFDLLCNEHTLEVLVDVVDDGDTPTVHFVYSNTQWKDWVKSVAKAFVYNDPHSRNFCTVKAAAALLTRAEPTLSDQHSDLRGIAYVEE